MKIAVNTRFLIKGKLEGIGWFTYESMKRITQQHPEHEFIFIFDRPYDEEFIFSDNITPVVIGPQARHPILFYIWFERSVTKVLKKYKPDIFVSTDGYLSLRTEVPSLQVIHDINFEHYPEFVPFMARKHYRYFFPKYARKAKRIATVSEYSRKDIVTQYDVPFEKIDVTYNGSNEAYRPVSDERKVEIRKKISNGCQYFLFVGSLHPRKNISNLLKAFDQFKTEKDSDIKLLIVGEKYWGNNEMQSAYENMKFKNEVVFTGRLDSEQLKDVYASALALTYVSIFEGFGIPIVEAMYCDIPVITSTTSSMPEVGGDAVVYAEPILVESISNAMTKVAFDSALRTTMVEKGRIQREKFSWQKTADKLWASIEKMM